MKKKVLSVLLALAMAASMTACGKEEAAPTESAVTEDAAEEEAPAEEPTAEAAQELVIGENEDMGGYDPMSNMNPFTMRAMIFDTLIKLDYDYTKSPALATDWEMSEDGKTWTFTLREGVKFHDGEPWNAEAAKFNWEQRKAAGKDGTGNVMKKIVSMETPDEYTFVVTFSEPMYTLASDVTPPMYSFVSPKAFDENHEVAEPIGTGPYKFESWMKDTEIVLTANEDYYEGAPNLQKITFKIIPDSNARALALESGEIDLMSGRSALTSLETLKKLDNIQVLKTMGQTSVFVLMNTKNEVMSDINLRKAVAAAVDFKSAVPALLSDLAEPAENIFSPVFGEYVDQTVELPKYDPDAAKAYLKDAGYEDTDGDGFVDKNGQKLVLDITVTSNNEEDKALCAIMQDQLKSAGIELTITALDGATLKDRTVAGEYQLTMQGQNYVPTDDPTINYGGYWHSDSYYRVYTDDTLDGMVDELRATADPDERIRMHKEVQNYILDQTPVIMVFHRNNIILADKKVSDFEVAAGTWQLYKGLEKAKIVE